MTTMAACVTNPDEAARPTDASRRPWLARRHNPEAGLRPPQFLIIGSAKAATTWLQHCLHEHPQVFVPLREFHHFSWDYTIANPLDAQYLKHFAAAQPNQIVGENSNTYMTDPGAPARIADALPEVKLIACLRHPIDRAYSEYCMHYRTGRATADVEAYLDPDRSANPLFLESSLYHMQLSRYLAFFPMSRLHVYLHDDLKTDKQAVFSGVCRFLEVDETFEPTSLEGQVNTRNDKLLTPGVRGFVNSTRLGRFLAAAAKQTGTRSLVMKCLGRQLEYPPLPAGLRERLTAFYRPEVARLEQLLNRDLSHWLRG